jgi:hypothetical protein
LNAEEVMATKKKPTYELPANYVKPPNYCCKHSANGDTFTLARQNFKVMTDEQEAFVRSGKTLPEADGRPGRTGSVHLCEDCFDASYLAGGPEKSGWHGWKAEYDKRMVSK